MEYLLAYLVVCIPIIVLMIPNDRQVRVFLGIVLAIALFIFWVNFTKPMDTREIVARATIADLGERVQKGESNLVCEALQAYHAAFQRGYDKPEDLDWQQFLDKHLKTGRSEPAPGHVPSKAAADGSL